MPRSVLWFERVFLASLALGLVQAWIGWAELVGRAAGEGEGPGSVAALLGLTFFTMGALALLVSRGRTGWARWLLVALCLIGLPLMWGSFEAGRIVGSTALAAAQAAMQAGSLVLLFTKGARAWLAPRGR
jgi:hypothetical protein